jgi:hypothetical protein
MGFGSAIGGLLGGLGSKLIPIPGINGAELGNFLGGLVGFQEGGVVPSQRVFHTGQAMVVRKPRRTYQKSSGRKSRRKK